jgi:outer membrane protein OmpA-like peptidoglycan-associated protein
VALELGLTPALGVQLKLANIALSVGDPPGDPTLAAQDAWSAQTGMLGARVRPLVRPYDPSKPLSPAGLWFDANAGVAKTSYLARIAFDAHLGFDFLWDGVGAGPFVGYTQVVQPDDALRPDDAHVFVFGVHAFYGMVTDGRGDYDGDRVIDARDRCSDRPEDKDGFQDADGCPDPDNDGDGVPDDEDACAMVPGRKTEDPKTNGCPVGDRDKDGVVDDVDRCPDEAEDKDGFEDFDGCPEPDNDKDGISDLTDKCPNEPELFNRYADEDGCPDSEQVRVVGDKILLDDRVHFQASRAVVLRNSEQLLWRVAQLILKHPEYVRIRVDGYADQRGEESYNQKLSEARARAVMEVLIKDGVARERLTAVGYGTANPRVPEKDEKAWYQNRRTEFTLTRSVP